jgi:type IV pilus assembly protein PilA
VRAWIDARPEMRAELGEFLSRTVGVDLSRVDGALLWSTQPGGPQPTVGAFIRLPGLVAPKGRSLGQHAGVELLAQAGVVVASVPGGLLIGQEPEVRAGIDAAKARAGAKSALGQLLSADRTADMAIAVDAAGAPDPAMQQVVQQWGLRALTFVLRGNGLIVLEAIGDARKLESARSLIAGGAQMAIQRLKDEKDRAAVGDDVATGVGAIVTYHEAVAFWKEFQPKLVGDRLAGQYQLPKLDAGSGALVAIVGVLSAVAIPAFMKYVRRSKTIEATANLRRLADESIAYYESHRKNKGFTFPASTEWTPQRNCCGQPGDKCAPDASVWKGKTWTALNFSVNDPHYYQYRVQSSGKGKTARTIVEARGDLDCDGTFSSFKREIAIDAQGNASGGVGLMTQDEIE